MLTNGKTSNGTNPFDSWGQIITSELDIHDDDLTNINHFI